MKVREEWKQTVSAKQGVMAMLVVILAFGGMGALFLRDGPPGPIPPTICGIVLVMMWVSALWDWRRFGKSAFPFWRIIFLAGFSMFFGGHLMVTGVASREWLINLGTLLIAATSACGIFNIRAEKERQSGPNNEAREI